MTKCLKNIIEYSVASTKLIGPVSEQIKIMQSNLYTQAPYYTYTRVLQPVFIKEHDINQQCYSDFKNKFYQLD